MLKKVLLSAAVIASFGYATQVNAQTCTNPLTVTITGSTSGVPLTASAAVTSDYNGSDVSCGDAAQGVVNDGEITVTASGGSGTLTYSKDGGANYQPSNVFTGLVAGPYTFVVKDANGCLKTTNTVTIVAPDPITAGTCTVAQDLCQVDGGSVTVEATGGTGTLNSTWTATPVGLPTAGGSPAGNVNSPVPVTYTGLTGNKTYHFKVTDANGCVAQ